MIEPEQCEHCGEELPYSYIRRLDKDIKKPISVLLFCDNNCVEAYRNGQNKKTYWDEENGIWKSEG